MNEEPVFGTFTLLGHDLEGADDAHDRHFRALKDDVRPFPDAGTFLRRVHDVGLLRTTRAG